MLFATMSLRRVYFALLVAYGCVFVADASSDAQGKERYGSADSGDAEGRTRRFSDYYQDIPAAESVPLAETPTVTPPPKRPACPNGIHYEPLYRMGSLFLARVVRIPGCPLTLPYTKNRTILLCTLWGTLVGTLFGFLMGWFMKRRFGSKRPGATAAASTQQLEPDSPKSPPASPVPNKTEEFRSPVTVRRHMAKLNLDDPRSAKKESSPEGSGSEGHATDPGDRSSEDIPSSEEKALHRSGEEPDGTAQLISHEMGIEARREDRMIKEWKAMRESMQELTLALHRIQKPLVAVVRVIRRIASEVNILKRLALWQAARQAKVDAWQRATDSMYYGLFVMNVSLCVSAFLFGRWQDWGQSCDLALLSWDIYLGFRIIWCVIEEPVYFMLGCGMWCLTTMVAFSCRLLKRKDPLSTFLLLMVLVFTGAVYSWAVMMLGGSWRITFSVWVVYTLFLIQILESAKDVVLRAALECTVPSEIPAVIRGLTSWESMHTAAASLIFPLIAGALPFWNVGLSLLFTRTYDRMFESYAESVQTLYDQVTEFLLY